MFSLLFALFARCRSFGVVVVVVLAEAQSVQAQPSSFEFRRIAEEFPGFGYPALDAGRVAFVTSGANGFSAIYEGPIAGPFSLVVDKTTLVPGAEVPFGSLFYPFGFDAGRVAFYGGQGAYQGIYLFEDGVINAVATPNTPMPSSMRTFNQFSWPPTVDDGRVVFTGQSGTTPGVQPLRGVYMARDEGVSRIADTTMPSPGDNGNFTSSFQDPVIEGDKIAFVGNWPERSGIFLQDLDTGVQSRIVDTNTPVPGRDGTFGSFHEYDLDDERLAFTHSVSATAGIFVADLHTGSLTTIAETGMAIPGNESMHFGGPFQSVSIDGGRVAFGYLHSDAVLQPAPRAASQDEFYGVYSNLTGELSKVIATGDVLDGKAVFRTHVDRQGLQGNQILVDVLFEDGTGALYLATLIPEPATMGLAICGCLGLALMGRLAKKRQLGSVG